MRKTVKNKIKLFPIKSYSITPLEQRVNPYAERHGKQIMRSSH